MENHLGWKMNTPWYLVSIAVASLLVLTTHSCVSLKSPIEITMVQNRVRKPPIGFGVLDFYEALDHFGKDSSYFIKYALTDKYRKDSLINLIEADGKYIPLPDDWYVNLFQENWPQGSRVYYDDVSENYLDYLFPSHLINVSYRLVLNGTDTVFIGDCGWSSSLDIMLHCNKYYIPKNSFFRDMDGLIRRYLPATETKPKDEFRAD